MSNPASRICTPWLREVNWRRCRLLVRPGWGTTSLQHLCRRLSAAWHDQPQQTRPSSGAQLCRPSRDEAARAKPTSPDTLKDGRGTYSRLRRLCFVAFLKASRPVFSLTHKHRKATVIVQPGSGRREHDARLEREAGDHVPGSGCQCLQLPLGDLEQGQMPPRPPAAHRGDSSCAPTPT